MKFIRFFINSAGGILLAAALIRVLIAAGTAQILALPEPMLGIPLRYAVLIVAGIELTVALICLFGKQVRLQAGWLSWLTTNFVVFRIGLLLSYCHPQATCLGSLTDPLHLSNGIPGFIIGFLPFYLLSGSYAAVIWLWLAKEGKAAKHGKDKRSHDAVAESLKMFCVLCGGHIEFSSYNLGQKIPCPHCKATITLMKPKNIKTSCPDCGGHIEFPLHGLGQTIACPHCEKNLTLQMPV